MRPVEGVPDSLRGHLNTIGDGKTNYKVLFSVCFLLFPDTPSLPSLGLLEDCPGGNARSTATADDAPNAYSQWLK